jgi:hypothetical protein
MTYESTADFRRGWGHPSFQKLISNADSSWTQLEPNSLPHYSDEYSWRAPPEAVQPGGSRIYLDEQESFVSWLGFSFNFAFSQVNGVALYDIVWFDLGTHHVPHTGDIPNTLMTTSASSALFVPHNYHVRDRSRALTNGVRMDASRDGTYQATYLGPAPRPLGRFSPNPRPVRKYPADDTDTAL